MSGTEELENPVNYAVECTFPDQLDEVARVPVRNRTPSATFEASHASITPRGQSLGSRRRQVAVRLASSCQLPLPTANGFKWPRRDLNPHARRQRLLRPPRLPFRHLAGSQRTDNRRQRTGIRRAPFRCSLYSVICSLAQCVGQESNLHSVAAGGLQPLRLANAQPTRVPGAGIRSQGSAENHSP